MESISGSEGNITVIEEKDGTIVDLKEEILV